MMKDFIKVYPGADKTRLLLKSYIGDINDGNGKKIAELQSNWTYSTMMVEVNGDTYMLDIDKFVRYILENCEELLREEMKRCETGSIEDIQQL